jgi:topoisomerase IV subunit A
MHVIAFELKESKEKTLLDDFDIQEVPIKKEISNSKKKNTIKYEKITLEDILNDDEF